MHALRNRVSAFIAHIFLLASLSVQAADYYFIVEDGSGRPLANTSISAPAEAHSISAETTSPQVSDRPAIMDQINKTFAPGTLAISSGQRVRFPNSDNIRHHVYSFSPAKPFELKLYSGTPEAPILFDTPGVVVLGCNIHDSMIGYIYIANSHVYTLTNTQGIASFKDITVIDTIHVWHPSLSPDAQTILELKLSELPQQTLNNETYFVIRITPNTAPIAPKKTFKNRLLNHENK